MKKIYPLTICENNAEVAHFYVTHFGFRSVFEQDWYVHLLHEQSGVELAFMAPQVASQPRELQERFTGKGMVLSFEVTDAKAEYERLKKAGVAMVLELRDEPWGQRHCIVRDPAGVYIDIVQQDIA